VDEVSQFFCEVLGELCLADFGEWREREKLGGH